MNLQPIVATLAVLTACDLCDPTPSKLQHGFERIVVNETTATQAIELMGGQPAYQSKNQWLGIIDISVLMWSDRVHEYSVTLAGSPATGVMPRVIAKGMQPRSSVKK